MAQFYTLNASGFRRLVRITKPQLVSFLASAKEINKDDVGAVDQALGLLRRVYAFRESRFTDLEKYEQLVEQEGGLAQTDYDRVIEEFEDTYFQILSILEPLTGGPTDYKPRVSGTSPRTSPTEQSPVVREALPPCEVQRFELLCKQIDEVLGDLEDRVGTINVEEVSVAALSRARNYLGQCDKLMSKYMDELKTFVSYIGITETFNKTYFERRFFSFDRRFRLTIDQCNEIILRISTESSDVSPEGTVTLGLGGTAQTIDLSILSSPTLKVPQFSGRNDDWNHFISRFTSVIDDKRNMTPQLKFQFLLDALDESSRKLISHLSFDGPSYKVALKLLKEKYDNPRRSLCGYVNQLLSLPSITSTSAASLDNFLTVLTSNFSALESIDNVDPYQAFFLAYLQTKLDKPLKFRFENSLSDRDLLPTMGQFVAFLRQQLKVGENARLLISPSEQRPPGRVHRSSRVTPKSVFVATPQSVPPFSRCALCGSEHPIFLCSNFNKMSVADRMAWVRLERRCYNCLGSHFLVKCRSDKRCNICHQRHHSLLHMSKPNVNPRLATPLKQFVETATSLRNTSSLPKQNVTEPAETPVIRSVTSPTLPSCCTQSLASQPVLMATCLINLHSPDSGVTMTVRGVVDTAAAASFVTTSCVNYLRAAVQPSKITIGGISKVSCLTKGVAYLSLLSKTNQIICDDHSFVVLDALSHHTPISEVIVPEQLSSIKEPLADPSFFRPAPLDCIIGADIAAQLITGPPLRLNSGLFLLPSIMGYLVMGAAPPLPTLVDEPLPNVNISPIVALYTGQEDSQLNDKLEKFWLTEEVPAANLTFSPLEQACEQFFKQTTVRVDSGRYQVRLPFLNNIVDPPLGDSYRGALARFLSLERRFAKDIAFHAAYSEFMNDYLAQGHMLPATGHTSYFIPHHGVFKSKGETNKLRVVFNASAPTSRGCSLNDYLHIGPKLHPLIADVITLFRLFPYVFTCDIKQMFRQILVHPSDYKYQCILWRERPSAPLRVFYLTTVTYGTRPAPYLAIRVLQQLAKDESTRFPLASPVLLNHSYVDDIAVGATTLTTALELRDQLQRLLAAGGFHLGKWSANHPSLFPDDAGTGNEITPILGLDWNRANDTLNVNVIPPLPAKVYTKRIVLARVAQIYDPCGWFTPFVLLTKVFLQQLWLIKLDWDDALPPALTAEWLKLEDNFSQFSKICLYRPITRDESTIFQLHGFADASKKGSAAAVYLCVEGSQVNPVLVAAKSKVAPLKTLTIPRLELVAAVMLSKLAHHIWTLLTPYLQLSRCVLWSDSRIVLEWIKTPPHQLKIFEGHRVAFINEIIGHAEWNHVASEANPADIASRGLPMSELLPAAQWWSGPQQIDVANTCLQTLVTTVNNNPTDGILSHLNSWETVLGVTTVILKWRNLNEHVSVSGINLAIFRLIQRESMTDLIELIAKNRKLPRSFQRLTPFLDDQGLVRVGGRLSHSPTVSNRHPILLLKRHYLLPLLVDYYHRMLLHAGSSTVYSFLFNKYWVIGARQLIRSVIYRCKRCFRARPKHQFPLMAPLPSPRVTQSLPFTHTGMDFAGPFQVRSNHLRKSVHLKVYTCIFICFASTMVHLEVATSLSTEDFIDVLLRFIARRGQPHTLYSDCGTNFVGASNVFNKHFKALLSDSNTSNPLRRFALLKEIQFQFNTPYAPHQGGLWERAVRTMKTHLHRVLLQQIPTLVQFISLVTQIEGVMNSRPLLARTSDSSDFDALTPAHLALGRAIHLPPLMESSVAPLSMKQFHQLQNFLASFWNRWRKEYLPTLQPRVKWYDSTPNIKQGDLVIISEPNVPTACWPLGRVVEVHPDHEGVVRKVTLKTSTGVFSRAVTKLCPLPVEL